MDRRRTTNLDGKCGSCRFFATDHEWECTGFCSGSKNHKGRLMRTYKCKDYEAALTIIEAEEE